jgi:hypothetical protein
VTFTGVTALCLNSRLWRLRSLIARRGCRKGAKFAEYTAFSSIIANVSCLFSLALEFSTRFRGGSFQPLTHLSASDNGKSSAQLHFIRSKNLRDSRRFSLDWSAKQLQSAGQPRAAVADRFEEYERF